MSEKENLGYKLEKGRKKTEILQQKDPWQDTLSRKLAGF